MAAVASTDLEKATEHEVAKGAVSPQDEPSAEWGWHGSFPRGRQIAGWFAAVACFLMLIGNQTGRIEDIYLVLTGATLVLLLIWDLSKRRNPWRR